MAEQKTKIAIDKFVLHQSDRDPETGLYGGDRIYTTKYGDMDISSINVDLNLVHAQGIRRPEFKITFQLPPNATSDLTLFQHTIVARWNELKEHYKDDDDYSDYVPAYYLSLQDINDNNLHIVQDTEKGG